MAGRAEESARGSIAVSSPVVLQARLPEIPAIFCPERHSSPRAAMTSGFLCAFPLGFAGARSPRSRTPREGAGNRDVDGLVRRKGQVTVPDRPYASRRPERGRSHAPVGSRICQVGNGVRDRGAERLLYCAAEAGSHDDGLVDGLAQLVPARRPSLRIKMTVPPSVGGRLLAEMERSKRLCASASELVISRTPHEAGCQAFGGLTEARSRGLMSKYRELRRFPWQTQERSGRSNSTSRTKR